MTEHSSGTEGRGQRSIPLWLRALRAYCRISPVTRGKYRLVDFAYRHLTIPDLETNSNLDSVGWIKLRLRVYVDFNIYCLGLYEHYLARFFIRQLTPESVVLDVGAYIGQYAMLAAHFAPRGFAYAFEPLPESASRLTEALRGNGINNCEVINSAIGDSKGSLTFYVSEQPSSSSAFASHSYSSVSIEVPVTTIDAFCAERNLTRLDILKVDVEEAEDAVLAGARTVLDRFRPLVLLEVGRPANLREPSFALACLAGLGYRFFRINHGHLAPISGVIQALESVVALPAHHPLTRISV